MAQNGNFGGITSGISGLLIIVGIILFIFPEPATSGLGATLIFIGLLLWVVGWIL